MCKGIFNFEIFPNQGKRPLREVIGVGVQRTSLLNICQKSCSHPPYPLYVHRVLALHVPIILSTVQSTLIPIPASKAVNRGDKRTRRVRDRDFVKFERSRRYRNRYRCQEKKSHRGRARDLVF